MPYTHNIGCTVLLVCTNNRIHNHYNEYIPGSHNNQSFRV